MFVLAVVTSYTIRGENNRNVSPEFTIFVIPLKNIVMSDSEKIKELEAIIVVLAKKIEEIRRKTIGGATMQSDENWLKDLKKEASKLNL